MNKYGLHSLLSRGTKTWQNGNRETTIDLTLVSNELAERMIKCVIYETEHGSDHRAIETELDITIPGQPVETRLLFKNAPWSKIRDQITDHLRQTAQGGSVQQQTDRLMTAVLEAVNTLTPRAKPSPYTKRWWTADLTALRRIYTYWRNRARTQRRTGQIQSILEQQAKDAAREYHYSIRRQRNTHWEAFLADDSNIWQAAKYQNTDKSSTADRIPPLKRADDTITKNNVEQTAELASTFFPSLPTEIKEEGSRSQRKPLPMVQLTMEEVERAVSTAKPWKAPGHDGLPAMVWKQIWPAVKERVLELFQTSLSEGTLPAQWKQAKIIPLKKPNKGDYTVPKAWRPISLLPTLGKLLEAVIAERISYMAETSGLLPANHFGARRGRSAEQDLLLLQEHIYQAWRSRKVLSLISFDVKGAYNGVYRERLLQRLTARGIPTILVRWIEAFCSERTASFVINGTVSQQQRLPQAGLPQGSPLSPVLFLFFNADLVQRQINKNGGALAFVDDYNAWITGPTAAANRDGIQTIINQAMEWERRSGATFEADKTAIIHFSRSKDRLDSTPFTIKGKTVTPSNAVKILGLTMDTELRYKQHLANAASKGLKAAMALRRLRLTSPSMARRLFEAKVAPVMDYAANVWMHAGGESGTSTMNRVQKLGAQAVTGAFRTVATAVSEAEACIRPISERYAQRATKLWISLTALSKTHPLSRSKLEAFKRFKSPLQRLGQTHRHISTDGMEVIQSHTVAPWEERVSIIIEPDREKSKEEAKAVRGIIIASSSSVRKRKIGMGGVIIIPSSTPGNNQSFAYSVTLGTRAEQNPYTAELAAMAMALRCLPQSIRGRHITILTSNQAALQALRQPRCQSGQSIIAEIYSTIKELKTRYNTVLFRWIPAGNDLDIGAEAKKAARQATQAERIPEGPIQRARSTTINIALDKRGVRKIPNGVGTYSKEIDIALPGKHTRVLYDSLKRKEANLLIQLRTGKIRLNKYLYQIGAAESPRCACGYTEETVKHFLFRCTRWTSQRILMLQQTEDRRGNLSFALGGKTPTDKDPWTPNIGAVRATIKYAIATGRLEDKQSSNI